MRCAPRFIVQIKAFVWLDILYTDDLNQAHTYLARIPTALPARIFDRETNRPV